jgi:hypothetical protein
MNQRFRLDILLANASLGQAVEHALNKFFFLRDHRCLLPSPTVRVEDDLNHNIGKSRARTKGTDALGAM